MLSIILLFSQVICALILNHTKNQWIDLGIHTEVCMTRPEICGAAGGAISLWLKLFDSPSSGGIISSWVFDLTASTMHLLSGNLRYDLLLSHSI